MLLNITKSMMILAMLFLFSCSKDSTSTNPDTDNEVLQSTSASMTLSGEMSGDKTVSILSSTSTGSANDKSYVIQGLIGMQDVAQIMISSSLDNVGVTLTNTIAQKMYLAAAPVIITRNDDKVLEGTFSGEADAMPPSTGKITITNGKFYINKTKF